jgi:hypothetical protein
MFYISDVENIKTFASISVYGYLPVLCPDILPLSDSLIKHCEKTNKSPKDAF